MFNAISQFRDAIKASGLIPPDVIEPGKLHRFPGVGKHHGNTAGWGVLFDDGLGGCFGDWASGFSDNWQSERQRPYSPAEKAEFKRRVNEARARAKEELRLRQDEAAEAAVKICAKAEPANDDHTHLVRKRIKSNGAQRYKGALVLPIRIDGEITSLQFISADSSKRFLKGGRITGGYFSIGTVKGAEALCIAEGFATGATIHQTTGYPVVVAFNAGNLEPVAKAMRHKLPDLPIIICADDDATTTGNPGITKASSAAVAIGGKVAIPKFGDNRPDDATDFNDMAAIHGPDAVTDVIRAAMEHDHDGGADDNGWPEPLPLIAKIDPESYPLDALPDTLRAAVEEVQAFTKAPIPLVASSALAALSLAVQAHADVKRAEKLSGPVGLFLLTIADSGERKSTCDGFFMQVIRDYEAEQAESAKPLIKDHKAAMEAWDAEYGGIKEKIRQLAKAGKPAMEQKESLRDLEHDKPDPPRVPHLIYGDATPEALKWNLAKGWPSGGVVSSEAGLVFGAHGMGKDSVMRNLATLNQLWDGADIATERRTTESFTVRGARLTIALQIQEATLRSFLERSGGLARGTGFLARFLVAWPESTQGNRPFTDPPDTWPALAKFNQRITAILEQDVPIDEDGALSPPVFPLAADTKAAWVMFHDAIESELCSGGELYDVRDVASKTADNAARIATLFQLFEHGSGGAIGLVAFEGASRIAAWHLHEARRFYGELAAPKEQADAARLDSWLIDYCSQNRTHIVGKRHVRQYGPVRDGKRLDAAISELTDLDRLRLTKVGKQMTIYVNPSLLFGTK